MDNNTPQTDQNAQAAMVSEGAPPAANENPQPANTVSNTAENSAVGSPVPAPSVGSGATSTDAAAPVSPASETTPVPTDEVKPELSQQKLQHTIDLRIIEEQFHALLYRIDGAAQGVARLGNEQLHQAAIKVMEAVELARRFLLGA